MAKEETIERITEKKGKVVLDYTHYSGKDYYSDGKVEDELLQISEKYAPVEFQQVIEERADWPTLYHLSSARENIVRWLPITSHDKVLEVGAGCGAVTGALTALAGEVVSCDLSKKRSLINANRHSDAENLTIHVGNFTDIEEDLPNDFDYICLIGVFEYGASYIKSQDPYADFLKILMKHLKPDGRLIIAIENRIGLKYFAGCREDHLSRYFAGIEGYDNRDGVRTFSKDGLINIFKRAGIDGYQFYYPYPDYKFMHTLFSDKRLPRIGELKDNYRNFDMDRLELFSEKAAFDSFVKDGSFDRFSNSFLCVIGPDTLIDYARFSNDRARQYQIYTSIERIPVGKRQVRIIKKKALFKEGIQHILDMERYYEGLTARYEGGDLAINRCEVIKKDTVPEACFEYVGGVTLEELLDECLRHDDLDGFYALFDRYLEYVGYNEDERIADTDVVFSNILVDHDKWTLIDYEWTKESRFTLKETAFRAIYCYLLEDKSRQKINLDLIYDKIDLSHEAAALLKEDEATFQKKVTGKFRSMQELRDIIGKKILDPYPLINSMYGSGSDYRFRIYPAGPDNMFSEETAYDYEDAYDSENTAYVAVPISGNDRIIRLDPFENSCIVNITEADIDGNPYPVDDKKFLRVNGKRIGEKTFVFSTTDPNLEFVLEGLTRDENSLLNVKMEITKISPETAEIITKNIKRIF